MDSGKINAIQYKCIVKGRIFIFLENSSLSSRYRSIPCVCVQLIKCLLGTLEKHNTAMLGVG